MDMRHVILCVALLAGTVVNAHSSLGAEPSGTVSIVDRFLTRDDDQLTSYRAVRHMSATSRGGKMKASMTVLTTLDPETGFTFTELEWSGSALIRKHVFIPALRAEREANTAAASARGALTPANYAFVERDARVDGLRQIDINARRTDTLLVDGSILVTDEGDLVWARGQLVKRPSFWTRRVEVVRRYQRIAGIRVPVGMNSIADVLMAGRSTFEMTYEYQVVNGRPVDGSTVSTD